MIMRMSRPVETDIRFPTRTVWSQIRRFARLFFRQLWRSGVTPLLPLVIAFGVWYTRLLIGEGVVLWHEASISIAMIYAIVGPLGAALSAWSSGRPRRRYMDDQLTASALPGWQQDLLTFATSAGIGVIVYGTTALVIIGWVATQATWGFPYGVVILSGLWMVVLFSVFGTAVGLMLPNHLTSLLAAGVTGGSVAFGNTIQNYSADANVRELTLWNTLLNLRDGFNPWVADRVVPELFENMLMATSLCVFVITLTLVIRHHGPIFISAVSLAVILTISSIFLTVTGVRSKPVAGWMASETTASFEYVCDDQGMVEICLHPAWSSVQPLVDEMATAIFIPVAGLQSVPERIVQVSSYDPEARVDGTFYMPGGRTTESNLGFSLVSTVFPELNRDRGSMTNAELVIAGWLQQEAGGNAEIFIYAGPRYQASAVAVEQERLSAIDRFSALSPDQQRAWLEEHWDSLRAGELTLDDLP